MEDEEGGERETVSACEGMLRTSVNSVVENTSRLHLFVKRKSAY